MAEQSNRSRRARGGWRRRPPPPSPLPARPGSRADTRVASAALKPSTKPITIARAAGDRRRANRAAAARPSRPRPRPGRSSMTACACIQIFLRVVPPPRAARARGAAGARPAARRRRPARASGSRLAMDELGARLDGGRPARQPLRVDAAADARPRLEHDDAQSRARQARAAPPGPRRRRRRRRRPRRRRRGGSSGHAATMRVHATR